MRIFLVAQITIAIGLLSGCASYPPANAGAAYDDTYMQGHTAPTASPSFRPGLNPNDPRYGRGLCGSCDSAQTAIRQPGGWNAR